MQRFISSLTRCIGLLRNDFLEESAKRRNVAPSVVEVVEPLALGVMRIRSKRLVKGTARRDHAEIANPSQAILWRRRGPTCSWPTSLAARCGHTLTRLFCWPGRAWLVKNFRGFLENVGRDK